jgi:hypothetical protein
MNKADEESDNDSLHSNQSSSSSCSSSSSSSSSSSCISPSSSILPPLSQTTPSDRSLISFDPIILDSVSSVPMLMIMYSRDHIKNELTRLGLKCGGTTEELAVRLFSIKGVENNPEKWDKKLFAKK